MLVGRSEKFKQHFLVTHFFNPPRYMKLLELVAGPDTAPGGQGPDRALGQGVARQGHRLGQGHAQLRRQPDRRPLDDGGHPPHARDGAAARGRRRDHRPADGPPQERDLPHRRHGRPRHPRPRGQELPRGPGERRGPRGLRDPAVPGQDDRGRPPRQQDPGRLLQEGGQGHPDPRPDHRRVPGQGRQRRPHQGGQGDRQGRGPARAHPQAGRGARRGRRVRVEGAVEEPGLRGPPDRRDHRLGQGDR